MINKISFTKHESAMKHINFLEEHGDDFSYVTNNCGMLNSIGKLLTYSAGRCERFQVIANFLHHIEATAGYTLDTFEACKRYHYKRPETILTKKETEQIYEYAKKLRQTLEKIAENHKNDMDWAN